jgi:hypothetical protein
MDNRNGPCYGRERQDQIKPVEYQELGAFRETPDTPRLDPVSKFETFEAMAVMICETPLQRRKRLQNQTQNPSHLLKPSQSLSPSQSLN